MKKNILALGISALAIAVALASCDKPFVYTPGEPEDVSKTYVGALISGARNIEAAGEDIEVAFLRNSTSGALEVTLFLEDTTNIFSLASSTITFADGDSIAKATVKYDYANLVKDVTYNIVVGVASEELISEYVPANFPLAIIKAWQNLGLAQFYDGWFVGGPFEKTLLKSPDGSDTYRLVDPWTEEEVNAAMDGVNWDEGDLEYVSPFPYLEFSIDEKGNVKYDNVINLGFLGFGMTLHFLHPSMRKDAASEALNIMADEKVAQFCWYPVLRYSSAGYSWWGQTAYAWISFPGGPDLEEWLAE